MAINLKLLNSHSKAVKLLTKERLIA